MCKGPAVGKHMAQSSCCKQVRVGRISKGNRAGYEIRLVRSAEARQTSLVLVITGVGKID